LSISWASLNHDSAMRSQTALSLGVTAFPSTAPSKRRVGRRSLPHSWPGLFFVTHAKIRGSHGPHTNSRLARRCEPQALNQLECARRNLPSELSGSQRTGASSNIASARSTRQWFSVPRQPDEKTNEPAARHDQIEACPAHQVAALNWLYSLGSIRHAVVLLERILGTKAGSIRLN
jgi:hypothetical protein